MLMVVWGGLALVCQTSLSAQEAPATSIDVSYVSDGYLAAIVVHPARLATAPTVKPEIEPLAKALTEQFGVEPGQVEQILLLWPEPQRRAPFDIKKLAKQPAERPLLPVSFHGVIRLREPAASELLARMAKSLGYGELRKAGPGEAYWKASQRADIAFHLPDQRTIFFADEKTVQARLSNRPGSGRLAELLKKADGAAEAFLVVDPAALARQVSNERQEWWSIEPSLRYEIASRVLTRLDLVKATVNLAPSPHLKIDLDAISPADAELLHDLVIGSRGMTRLLAESLQNVAKGSRGPAPHVPLALADLSESLLRLAKVARTADHVVVMIDLKDDSARLIAGRVEGVFTAVESARTAASLLNLLMLALGMHNHHDVLGFLPSHASYVRDDKAAERKGKPLLSWRVHLLPYIEHGVLWQKFKYDEPWDSPRNKSLISQMPSVYASPGRDLGEGKTSYLLPISSDKRFATVFPPGLTDGNIGGSVANIPKYTKGLSLSSITDGTSSTLMIVEVPPEKAVIWTKPDDWEVDLNDPKKGLFGARTGFLLAATADAKVHRIPQTVAADTLRRAFGRSDGEKINLEELLGPMSPRKH
jgi:hypothetical protein